MSFNGPALSFDDEGSILFDGEKIIVTVPAGHEVLDHLGAEEDIPFPVVYTHPRHAQNQQPSSSVAEPAGSGGSAGTTSTPKPPVYFDDVAAYGQRAEQRAAAQLEALADISDDGQFQPDTSSQPVEPTWHDTTPLTHLQAEYVDHLLAVETDSLAREVLLGLKREGMPSEAYVRDFMFQFAEWGWDDLSSALAWQVLANVRNSHWDEMFANADEDYVEAVAQGLGDNRIEGLTIIHAGTGDILLDRTGVVRADGSQYVGLQDYEVEALKGLPLIFVHNHTEEVGASDEDLDSAFRAGAELLIVITPSGREQVFVRGRDRMVLVRDEQASYEVGPSTREEAIELVRRSEAQARKYLKDSPEYLFLQEEQYVQMRVNGDLKLYESEEAVLRGDVKAVWPHPTGKWDFIAWDQSASHPYAVKIGGPIGLYWIDLRDPSAELVFSRVDLPPPYSSLRAQVSGQEYDNTSLEFLSALTEALEPQPIGIMHVSGTLTIYFDEELNKALASEDVDPSVPISVYEFSKEKDGAVLIDMGFGRKYWVNTNDSDADFELHLFEDAVATDAPSGYEILPIVPDEIAHGGEWDIEVSDEEWADRTGRDDDPTTKRGVLSRDYNHVRDEDNPRKIHKSFRLQSPVVGQDVRVEFVVRDHETLGNYVVISFPAYYYQSNDEVMQRLEMQRLAAQRLRTERPDKEHFASLADHNPDRWSEDGRIFYAFAHLSEIAPHIQPGEYVDSHDKTIIGMTGKSGTSQHHLDLVITYFGSNVQGSGTMDTELNILRSEYKRTGSNSVDYFFGLAMRSQLDPYTKRFDLYGENLDSARLHPELDESDIAEFMEGNSIYAK